MKLHLVDADAAVAAALQAAFAPFPEVDVGHGDLLSVAEHCVVPPANSYGFMDGGFDRELLSFFGPQVQGRVQDAIAQRPEGLLPVGASLLVRTGHQRIPFLLVAPTMVLPEQVESFHAYRAMRALLRVDPASFPHVFCPGLATGVGGVSLVAAAEQMARAYRDHTPEPNHALQRTAASGQPSPAGQP